MEQTWCKGCLQHRSLRRRELACASGTEWEISPILMMNMATFDQTCAPWPAFWVASQWKDLSGKTSFNWMKKIPQKEMLSSSENDIFMATSQETGRSRQGLGYSKQFLHYWIQCAGISPRKANYNIYIQFCRLDYICNMCFSVNGSGGGTEKSTTIMVAFILMCSGVGSSRLLNIEFSSAFM